MLGYVLSKMNIRIKAQIITYFISITVFINHHESVELEIQSFQQFIPYAYVMYKINRTNLIVCIIDIHHSYKSSWVSSSFRPFSINAISQYYMTTAETLSMYSFYYLLGSTLGTCVSLFM